MFSNNLLMAAAGGGGAGYVIEGSAMSEDANLVRAFETPAVNGQKIWVYSTIRKQSEFGGDSYLLSDDNDAGSPDGLYFDDEVLKFRYAGYGRRASVALFRDPAAYGHLVVAFDSTQGTEADRFRGWWNGVAITFTEPNTISQNDEPDIGGASNHSLLRNEYDDRDYFNGYTSLVSFQPTVTITDPETDGYGEFDDDGYWQILDISELSYAAANSFLLEGGTNISLGLDSNDTNTYVRNSSGLWSGDTGSWSHAADGTLTCDTAEKSIYTTAAIAEANEEVHVRWIWDAGSNTTYFGFMDDPSTDWSSRGYPAAGVAGNDYFVGYHTAVGYLNEWDWANTGEGALAASGANADDANNSPVIGAVCELIRNVAGNVILKVDGTTVFTSGDQNTNAIHLAIGSTNTANEDFGKLHWVTSTGAITDNWFMPVGTITATNNSPTNDADNGIGNYCTLNPLQNNANSTLSDGNLKSTGTLSYATLFSGTQKISQGQKIYFELTGSIITAMVGIVKTSVWASSHDSIAAGANAMLHIGTGDIMSDYGATSMVENYAPNQIAGDLPLTYMLAVDLENDDLYIGNADTGYWSDGAGTYDQAFGTATAISLPAGFDWLPSGRSYNGYVIANFGATAFTGTKPTGYSPLTTQNMPDPTIPDPTEHHQVELVSHDGTSTNVTCNWDMDVYDTLIIAKNRDSAERWYVADGLVGYSIHRNIETGVITPTTDSNVFSVSGTTLTLGSTLSTDGYVVEFHKAGLAASRTTAGGATRSENTTAGFSIIKDITGGGPVTAPHGLDSTPEFVWTDKQTATWNKVANWPVALGAGYIYLDVTNAWVSSAGGIDADATNITLGSTVYGAAEFIAYCWHSVEGYSAFGSYEGNGLTDGSMINVGFKPASVVLKSIDSTSSWHVYHDNREGYNPDNDKLIFETTAAEGTADEIDILSNGVKMRIATDPNVAETYNYSMWGGTPIQGPTPSTTTSQGRAR